MQWSGQSSVRGFRTRLLPTDQLHQLAIIRQFCTTIRCLDKAPRGCIVFLLV